jgi:hypothetical protein
MTFRLRKLYADVVSGDGTVTVVYLTWLEAWGARFAAAGVERYGPDGRRSVLHARPPAWGFDPDSVRDGWRVALELVGGGALELRYDRPLGPWRPPGPPPHPAMAWRVLIPRAVVAGGWSGPGEPGGLWGTGYCDWVELRSAPRLLGMRLLHWGHLHLPSETIVFTDLRFASGQRWSRAAHWHGAESQPGAGVVVALDEAGGVRVGASGAEPLALLPIRLLHDGSALDHARFPSAGLRLAVRVVAGSLHERRWLARSAEASSPGAGWCLHEVVRFGAGRGARSGDP